MARFDKGGIVRYGKAGVCRITGITTLEAAGEEREYYVLTPVFKPASTLYVPVDNAVLVAKMRPLITEEEIAAASRKARETETPWIHNFRKRSEAAHAALLSDDRADALCLIKAIFLRKKELAREGKRIHTTDDGFLREAETLFFGEVAFVTGEDLAAAAERFYREWEP